MRSMNQLASPSRAIPIARAKATTDGRTLRDRRAAGFALLHESIVGWIRRGVGVDHLALLIDVLLPALLIRLSVSEACTWHVSAAIT